MSFCTKCGRKRSGQERYCTACGTSLRVIDDQTGTVAAEVPSAEVPAGTVLADVPAGTVLAEVPSGEVPAGTVLAEVPSGEVPAGTVLAEAPDAGGMVPSGAEVAPSASPTMSIAVPPPPPFSPPPPVVPGGSVPGSGVSDTMPGIMPAAMPGAMPAAMPGAMPGGGQTIPPGWLPPAPPRSGRDWGTIVMVMAAVIVLAGAGVFAWLKFGRSSATAGRLGAVSGVTVTGSATASTSPTVTPSSPSPAPSVTPTQTSPASTLVPVAPGVANDAQTAAVDAFVTKYFMAINAHDYQHYLSLISPANRQNWTLQAFENGYGSTTDSRETLISITDYGSGVTGATLSFTSHQLPSQSATNSSCTDWESVTLFLRQSGGRYFIGTQLPGYHPQYSVC